MGELPLGSMCYVCIRPSDRSFSYVLSYRFYLKSWAWVIFLSFYSQGAWGSKVLRNVARFPHLVRAGVDIWTQSLIFTYSTIFPSGVHFKTWVRSLLYLPKSSPDEQKEFRLFRLGLISFLSLCLVFVLMGLDCISLQLGVSWDGSYRWNHSNLTFGNTGQFPLLWTPSLTSNIAWNTRAVSQSLKGFLLYRHLCCKGICCDGIWEV